MACFIRTQFKGLRKRHVQRRTAQFVPVFKEVNLPTECGGSIKSQAGVAGGGGAGPSRLDRAVGKSWERKTFNICETVLLLGCFKYLGR